jgi:hypothetical protein
MDGVPIDKTVVGRSAQSLCKAVAMAVRPVLGENAGEADGQVRADELWALLHGIHRGRSYETRCSSQTRLDEISPDMVGCSLAFLAPDPTVGFWIRARLVGTHFAWQKRRARILQSSRFYILCRFILGT